MGADRVEQLIESLPHSIFSKQHGELNHNKIQTVHKLASTDAASAETARGGVQHGNLAIVILIDAACHTLTGGNFMSPTNPVPMPTIKGGLAEAEIAM